MGLKLLEFEVCHSTFSRAEKRISIKIQSKADGSIYTLVQFNKPKLFKSSYLDIYNRHISHPRSYSWPSDGLVRFSILTYDKIGIWGIHLSNYSFSAFAFSRTVSRLHLFLSLLSLLYLFFKLTISKVILNCFFMIQNML